MQIISAVFQQYAQEYILSEPGSERESVFFNKIVNTYTPLTRIEPCLLTRFYVEAFIREVAKRENKEQYDAIEGMLDDLEVHNESLLVMFWKQYKH